ncbi:hypothetical protein C8Q77DRAFT_382234 [Trametes polyzona]|nr:hypothetical protein C8Q77DRAFT_382234 [Trametes polyzona]
MGQTVLRAPNALCISHRARTKPHVIPVLASAPLPERAGRLKRERRSPRQSSNASAPALSIPARAAAALVLPTTRSRRPFHAFPRPLTPAVAAIHARMRVSCILTAANTASPDRTPTPAPQPLSPRAPPASDHSVRRYPRVCSTRTRLYCTTPGSLSNVPTLSTRPHTATSPAARMHAFCDHLRVPSPGPVRDSWMIQAQRFYSTRFRTSLFLPPACALPFLGATPSERARLLNLTCQYRPEPCSVQAAITKEPAVFSLQRLPPGPPGPRPPVHLARIHLSGRIALLRASESIGGCASCDDAYAQERRARPVPGLFSTACMRFWASGRRKSRRSSSSSSDSNSSRACRVRVPSWRATGAMEGGGGGGGSHSASYFAVVGVTRRSSSKSRPLFFLTFRLEPAGATWAKRKACALYPCCWRPPFSAARFGAFWTCPDVSWCCFVDRRAFYHRLLS